MLKRSSTCLRSFTLIEVLAGLMILGTLLVSMILAKQNLLDQQARARRKLDAVRLADALLSYWQVTSTNAPAPGPGNDPLPLVPRNEQGYVMETLKDDPLFPNLFPNSRSADRLPSGDGDFRWRTQEIGRPDASWATGMVLVQLEIFPVGSVPGQEPLVRVELLLPAEGSAAMDGRWGS